MNRAERRRWEKESWPRWVNCIAFGRIKKVRPGIFERSEKRSKAEMVNFIDHLILDLEEEKR